MRDLPLPLQALLRELQTRERNDPHDANVRRIVQARARDACEYCLMPTMGEFHVDHVIPPALWNRYLSGAIPGLQPWPGRRGPNHLDNFAWACPFCNEAKGQQVTYRLGRRNYRLFDPRHDQWADHFAFADLYLFIEGGPGIGVATVNALGFNDSRLKARLGTRHKLIVYGQYPPAWARPWTI